jgi:CheY-like chemotaxis protein
VAKRPNETTLEPAMTTDKSVLIADSSADAVNALARGCGADGLHVVTATDGLQAMMLIAREPPDLAILDFDLPGADGVSICEQMARDAQTADVPVILLSEKSSLDIVSRCGAAGAHCVIKDAGAWDKIRGLIRTELGIETSAEAGQMALPVDPPRAALPVEPTLVEPQATRPKILVVDDDAHILEVFSIKLSIFGADVITATNGSEALTVAAMETPDVIVTDYMMPGGSGEYFIHHLKNDPILKDIPVIVLTGRTFQGAEDVALKRDLVGRYGADAFLSKPIDEERFLAELRKHVTLPDA